MVRLRSSTTPSVLSAWGMQADTQSQPVQPRLASKPSTRSPRRPVTGRWAWGRTRWGHWCALRRWAPTARADRPVRLRSCRCSGGPTRIHLDSRGCTPGFTGGPEVQDKWPTGLGWPRPLPYPGPPSFSGARETPARLPWPDDAWRSRTGSSSNRPRLGCCAPAQRVD